MRHHGKCLWRLPDCLQVKKDEEQCYTELRDLMSRSAGCTSLCCAYQLSL